MQATTEVVKSKKLTFDPHPLRVLTIEDVRETTDYLEQQGIANTRITHFELISGTGQESVSYTHLTLPTKRIV